MIQPAVSRKVGRTFRVSAQADSTTVVTPGMTAVLIEVTIEVKTEVCTEVRTDVETMVESTVLTGLIWVLYRLLQIAGSRGSRMMRS